MYVFFSLLWICLVNRTIIDTYQTTAQTRHEPDIKLTQSVHVINNTNHERSFREAISKQRTLSRMERSAFTIRLNYSTISVVKSDEKPARNDSSWQRPVFASIRKYEKLPFDPSTYECSDKHSIDCINKTKEFRTKVLNEFDKSLIEPIDESSNIYNVEYEHPDDMIKYNPTCMVLDAKLRILTNKDSPFDTNKIGRLFPVRKLFGKKFLSVPRSCVIVSSAGSLFQSGLGKFIGKSIHFLMLRFFCLLYTFFAVCDESHLHFIVFHTDSCDSLKFIAVTISKLLCIVSFFLVTIFFCVNFA